MNINIKIPDELNEERKKLDVTWRDIILAGFKYYELDLPHRNILHLKPNLKIAIKALKEVWDSVNAGPVKTPNRSSLCPPT